LKIHALSHSKGPLSIYTIPFWKSGKMNKKCFSGKKCWNSHCKYIHPFNRLELCQYANDCLHMVSCHLVHPPK
jgi:hypothetical protein